MKIKDLPEGKIKLNDETYQNYKIDKDQKHIAKVRKEYIVVNTEFLEKENNQQKTIIYHERQHLRWFNRRLLNFSRIIYCFLYFLAIILLFSILFLFIPIIKTNLMDTFYLSIITIFLSAVFILINYLNEIICDFNAVKNMGIKNYNETVIDYYKKKKNNDFIYHPHWKWRKRIMESLD